jgi:hypothetical protein
MARKSNVNPNHYKTAGRERQGEEVLQELHRQTYAQAKATPRVGRGKGKSKLITVAKPVKASSKRKKK